MYIPLRIQDTSRGTTATAKLRLAIPPLSFSRMTSCIFGLVIEKHIEDCVGGIC